MRGTDARDAFRERPGTAAAFVDFDGTLSHIATRPEEARAVEGAREALERLAARIALVALVSGRPTAEIGELIDAEGVEVFGLYGLEAGAGPDGGMVDVAIPLAEAAAAAIPGVWVERKGLSLAVHYREAADPDRTAGRLRKVLGTLGEAHGLHVLEGKRVIELAARRPSKGALVERVVRERALDPVMFAGDDLADLDAFDALDRLSASGTATFRVAVEGPETPELLLTRADLAVTGPPGLVTLLDQLASD